MFGFTFLFLQIHGLSQTTSRDSSSDTLLTGGDSITVTAFRQKYLINQLPASVAHLTRQEFSFLGGTSLLPAVNQVPGVRMEERSPGSYRFSIRGSLLRSPFGVRNIKVYLNQIPISDAGGNTYLNLLPASLLSEMDILKGPAASLYGAGTGGVLLLKTGEESTTSGTRIDASLAGGSFDLLQQQLSLKTQKENSRWRLDQDHQQSNGYREQTALRRDAISLQWQQKAGAHTFQAQLIYSHLFYQTPGGLTLAQMQNNPRQARPATPVFPSAVAQKTSVKNETTLLAVNHGVPLSDNWSIQSFLLGGSTRFVNPFITNYEQRKENNWGAGTTLRFARKMRSTGIEWLNGIEWLHQNSNVTNYSNKNGNPDTIQFRDGLQAGQWFVFSQLSIQAGDWRIDAGISLNHQRFGYERISVPGSPAQSRKLQSLATPRLSITRKISHQLQLQFLASRGFSPPTLAEIRPSDGNYYGDLQPESGWNLELGWRWNLVPGRINWTASLYRFILNQAIVRRNSSSGAEYFINAGETLQQGIENLIQWQMIPGTKNTGWQVFSQLGHSFQPYRFRQYQQGSVNFSGKSLTGVPQHLLSAAIHLKHTKGFYFQMQLNSTSVIPLNDANDEWSNPSQLLQAEVGWRWKKKGNRWQFFLALDNGLNQAYSLGNDINAAGRRFYNPSPSRNYVTGIRFNSRSFVF